MNRKILSGFTLLLLVLNAAGLSLANNRPKKVMAARQTNQLISKLPDSDAVAVMDVRRFFDEALPRLLGSKPALIGKITSGINDFQKHTGIDIRKFDQLAIGAKFTPLGDKKFDTDLVMLARGTMNAGTLIAGAKLAANGSYREEKFGDHSVYIFSIKDVAAKHISKTPQTGMTGALDNAIDKISGEMAVGTFDPNTLIIGSPARVRETFEAKTTVSPELNALLTQRGNAVLTFAARTPEGLDGFIPMENDELGKNLDAIRYLSGSVDVAAGNANISLMARAVNAERAQGIFDTVDFLQKFGKGLLSNSKRPENAVYARMIDSAKLAKAGTDITLDLSVAQNDIDVLLGALVKK